MRTSADDEVKYKGKIEPLKVIVKEIRINGQEPFVEDEQGSGVHKDNVIVVMPRKFKEQANGLKRNMDECLDFPKRKCMRVVCLYSKVWF